MERLCRHFAERPGKGYGWFEKDERSFPMPRLVREHAIEERMDFATLSKEMVALLQQRGRGQGGRGRLRAHRPRHRVRRRLLYVALLQETLGTVIGDGLSIQDSPHLDFPALQVAGRIDISAWQAGAERYISFLKGRGDVAGWFKRFLGCTDVVIALKETKKLVETLSHFADTQQLEAAGRDELLERAHLVLEEMGDSGAALNLEAVAAQIFPDAPQKLSETLQDEALDLASGFVPDKRALRPDPLQGQRRRLEARVRTQRPALRRRAVRQGQQHPGAHQRAGELEEAAAGGVSPGAFRPGGADGRITRQVKGVRGRLRRWLEGL
jgi:nucleoid-associated protein